MSSDSWGWAPGWLDPGKPCEIHVVSPLGEKGQLALRRLPALKQ